MTTLDPAVIRDLLPLYLAGEASPATRQLVEAHLAADPELARLARAVSAPEVGLPGRPPSAPSAGKAALDATRRRLRRRSWLMAGAILATVLPFSSYGGDGGVYFLLLRDAPATAALSLAAAGVLWIAFWRASKRLRVTGL